MRGAARFLALGLAIATSTGVAAQVTVREEPGTAVVSAEVLIAAGNAEEDTTQAGVAYLTARVATAPIRPILDSLGARLEVRAQKDAMAFTLLAAPDVWEEAAHLLLVSLFRDPIDPGAFERERRTLRNELVARELNPSDAATNAADRVLFGGAHPWARPAVGYSRTVAKLSLEDVDGFIRSRFLPERTLVAVVGPVSADASRARLLPLFQGATTRLPEPPAAAEPDSLVRRDYNSVTTWVVATYRAPADADWDLLYLLSSLVVERLAPGPTRPSVYDAASDVRRHARGGELRFQVVVPPAQAATWAARMDAAMRDFRETPMHPALFAAAVRRHRGQRLRELSSPDARARLAAREMLLGQERSTLTRTEAITYEQLQRAARSLSPVSVVLLGPLPGDAPAGPETAPEGAPAAPPAEPGAGAAVPTAAAAR